MSELAPVFRVQVWLDGDDYAPEATANVERLIRQALARIRITGAIRAHDVARLTEENPL